MYLYKKSEIMKLIEQRSGLKKNEILRRKYYINNILSEILNKSQNQEVFILGHMYPDCDSIISSIILKNILISKGIDAKFAILKDKYTYNKEDSKLLNEIVNEKPVVIENNIYNKYILVDSNDPSQSIGDENSMQIIGCIDHHIYTGKINNTIEIEYASTALLIYDLFKEEYNFSNKEKELIAYSVMADTEYLASTRYTKEDEKLYKTLGVNLDADKLRKKYFTKSNFNNGIENIFLEAYKEYNRENLKINKVAFRAYNIDDKYIKDLEKYMLLQEGIWFAIWNNYESKKTTVILKKDKKIESFILDYIITSANLIINEIFKRNLL